MVDTFNSKTHKMQQMPLDIRFPKLQGREDFIIGACNRLAAAWINRWPDWPKPGHSLNLVGPAGAGKSHLAAIWQEMCGARQCWSGGDCSSRRTSRAKPTDNGFLSAIERRSSAAATV